MMMAKKLLALLLFVLTLLTGVCPLSSSKRFVKAGEMVVLQCPQDILNHHGDTKLIWTSYTTQEMFVANNTASLEQWNMDVLVYGRSLVILSASVTHQGNYSCSLGNASNQHWFTLIVYSKQSRKYNEKLEYLTTCYTQEFCKLKCPHIKIPLITSNGITWFKEGESLPKEGYFSSVEKSDSGVYTCTRAYLYQGQIYNITLRVKLDVKLKGQSMILSPHNGDVFYVDLGSTLVIDCKAVMYTDFDEIFWLSNTSFVETNDSLPVFYNSTWEGNPDHIKMTASLIFKKVSEEDLLKCYTCKLESASEFPEFATITLSQKSHPVSLTPTLSIVGILVVIAVTVIVCVKFKIDIASFLRDTLGFRRGDSDGKCYDTFLMH